MPPDMGDAGGERHGSPLQRLSIPCLFLIWGPPQGTHRAQFLAQQLGCDLKQIYLTTRRGRRSAAVRYAAQACMTLSYLLRHPAELILVQSPPIFAALPVFLYSLLRKAHFIIDSHTDALLAPFWRWTLPLHRFLSRRGIATIVTNDQLAQTVMSWGARSFVLADVPVTMPERQSMHLSDSSFHVAVVSSASYDEPIDQVLEAARTLPDVGFYITGNYQASSRQQLVAGAPPNVHWTNYLPDAEFFGLLEAVDAVASLTTEDHTMQSGASEALWVGKPIITSDWPVLRAYFGKGAIHVDNTALSISQAIRTIKHNPASFEADVRALQEERRNEWWLRVQELVDLISKSLGRSDEQRSLAER